LKVGVEGNALLIFTQQIGEKAEILKRERRMKKERAQRSRRWEIERQSRRRSLVVCIKKVSNHDHST
jgi:hypothetical protein